MTGNPLNPIPVTLPEEKVLSVSLHRSGLDQGTSFCSVIKDGGDDPDVTHGAEVGARVRLLKRTREKTEVVFRAGHGVGMVTKPGLPVAVGEPAINPVPRQMIQWAVEEIFEACGAEKSQQVEVEVIVTEGEALAKKTLNPRLGVLGGISILGTTGIVRPLSHQAYRETIMSALSVARAAGRRLVLSTGGKSERFAMKLFSDLPEECFVQIADFYGFSLEAAVELDFVQATHSVFIGKLVKMAMGLHYTHASSGNMDLTIIAEIAKETGLSYELGEKLGAANTARHALEIMQETKTTDRIVPGLSARAIATSRNHSSGKLDIHLVLFDYNGQVIYRT